MRIPKPARYAISAVASAALLAACNGSGGSQSYAPSGSGVTSPMAHLPFMLDHKFAAYTGANAPMSHPDHGKSWISPDVKKAPRILFVTDYSAGDVYIYSMPSMALKGTLTGYYHPQGACSDKAGNIWVTDTDTARIYQYTRTGTLLKIINDVIGGHDYMPVGCAVDSSGDVAVSNMLSIINTAGNISVWHNGTGSPTVYTNPNVYEYFFPAYDSSGNLYVDGFGFQTTHGQISYILSVCRATSKYCEGVTVSGASLFYPGTVNWDRVNNQLVLGDQRCGGNQESCWYRGTVSGSTYTNAGTTILSNYDGTACDNIQGALSPFSKFAVGGCLTFGTTPSIAGRWSYPAGGDAAPYSTNVSEPVGAAISNK